MKKYIFAVSLVSLLALGCNEKEPVIIKPDAAVNAQTATFTMAEVAQYNTKAKCFTVVSGSVYDLTTWIAEHPGGEKEILAVCGKDGTKAFEGEHAGESQTVTDLLNFKVGTLAK